MQDTIESFICKVSHIQRMLREEQLCIFAGANMHPGQTHSCRDVWFPFEKVSSRSLPQKMLLNTFFYKKDNIQRTKSKDRQWGGNHTIKLGISNIFRE